MRKLVVACLGVAWALGASGCLSRTFVVSFDESVRAAPATGRLVVYLLADDGPERDERRTPGYSITDPGPMLGVDVTDLAPGATAIVGADATAHPVPSKNLPSGRYKALAVLDLARENSDWAREPGNLFSDVVEIELTHRSASYPIRLTHAVEAPAFGETDRVREVAVRSELLSAFRGRDVTLRAGVVLPRGYRPDRAYPALYVVPGFGGDHRGAHGWAARLDRAEPGSAAAALAESVVVVVLDPEGPNGHTLFADSANNGPAGAALVRELIPEIERRFPLIAEPDARLLRGHSSGGWSVVWLAITHPETFGAAWASAPDPVDFRAFQDIDVYEDAAAYLREDIEYDRIADEITYYRAEWVPSMRRDGKVVLRVRDENRMEEVLGPDNTSAQQWDSWFAAFGPRNERGHPAALWDHPSGRIDRRVAREYEAYDIGLRVEREPNAGRLLRERVRLICGDLDSFYLNQAVALLADRLERVPAREDDAGYVLLVPGADHGSILRTPEADAIPGEMLEHLRRHGYRVAGEAE